jgi:hypothetical protein
MARRVAGAYVSRSNHGGWGGNREQEETRRGPRCIHIRNLGYAAVMARKWCKRGGGWWTRSCGGIEMTVHEHGDWYVEGVTCAGDVGPTRDIAGAMAAAEGALRRHLQGALAERDEPVDVGRIPRRNWATGRFR